MSGMTSFPVMPGLFPSCPAFFRHARPDRASLLLQRLGRVGAGGAEGLPEDGQEGDGEG